MREFYPDPDLPAHVVDKESFATTEHKLIPQRVCTQHFSDAMAEEGQEIGEVFAIFDERERILTLMEALYRGARDHELVLVGHNFAYDMAQDAAEFPELLPLIFEALDAGGVQDTNLRERILDVRDGIHDSDNDCKWGYNRETDARARIEYHLAPLVAHYGLGQMEGKGDTQLRFHEVAHLSFRKWPDEFKLYAGRDPVYEWGLYKKQQGRFGDDWAAWQRAAEETRKSFSLFLMAAWGLRTDRRLVEQLGRETRSELDAQLGELARPFEVESNFPAAWKEKGRWYARLIQPPRKKKSGKNKGQWTDPKKNTKVIKARVELAFETLGAPVPRTDPSPKYPDGQTSTDGDTLKIAAEVDPVLRRIVDYNRAQKILGTFLPMLELGVDGPICPKVKPFIQTGRQAVSKPALNQLPRGPLKKGLISVRECFVPRRGKCYVFADYPTLELRTFAQTALWTVGWSCMADALNEGLDPHTLFASDLAGCTYAEAVARVEADDEKFTGVYGYRPLGKIWNFGKLGKLGKEGFIEYARDQYEVHLTMAQADELDEVGFGRWKEIKPFFEWIDSHTGGFGQTGSITLQAPPFDAGIHAKPIFEGLTRGNASATQAANFAFQGPAARAAKEAHFRVSWLCYAGGEESALFRHEARPVVFLHDEIGLEVPDDPVVRTECAAELEAVMTNTLREFIPDVATGEVKAVAMHSWHKKAKRIVNAAGLLECWEPGK